MLVFVWSYLFSPNKKVCSSLPSRLLAFSLSYLSYYLRSYYSPNIRYFKKRQRGSVDIGEINLDEYIDVEDYIKGNEHITHKGRICRIVTGRKGRRERVEIAVVVHPNDILSQATSSLSLCLPCQVLRPSSSWS